MSKKSRPLLWLALVTVLLLVGPTVAEEPTLLFHSSDKTFTVTTVDDFRVTYNPHAVLSLANLDDEAVVVTKHKADSTIDKLYDNFGKTLPAKYPIRGRVMITIDGQQAVAFVVEGLFPPDGEITHQTLLALTIHDGQEYDFMVHYPIEHEEKGLERAYALLATVKWAAPAVPPAGDKAKP